MRKTKNYVISRESKQRSRGRDILILDVETLANTILVQVVVVKVKRNDI